MITQKLNRISGPIAALPQEGKSRFIGMEVSSELIRPFFLKLYELNRGKEYFENHEKKWAGKYHVTLVSSVEFPLLGDVEIRKVIREEAEVELVGLGSASYGLDCCFFIVCESADLSRLRSNLALPRKDFHITIGFSNEDLHGISKGRKTLIKGNR